MPQTDKGGEQPRAIIHKQILNAAQAQPDASLSELANDVSGASATLIEQVLDEYGDPGAGEVESVETEPDEQPAEQGASEMAEDEAPASHETRGWMELGAKERETLRVVKENLTATQQEIGETLGVTAATVSNRLRDIDGFDWQDRQAFVSQLPQQPILGDGQGQTHAELPAEVYARLEELEQQVEALDANESSRDLPPELTHKILHACLHSDQFSEEEELAVVKALI